MYSLQAYFNLDRSEMYGFLLLKLPAGVLRGCVLNDFLDIEISKMEHEEFKDIDEAILAYLVIRDKMSRFIRPGGLIDLNDYEIENISYSLTVGDINIRFLDAIPNTSHSG